MTAPRFSVWISTRNAAPWIARSIGSLRSQGFASWEAVFIDDASTDATWQAAEAAAAGDARIRLIRNAERRRQVGCYLQALPLLGGDIVLELDGDDWLLDDALFHIDALYRGGADATCGQNNLSGGIPEIPRSRFFDRLVHSYAPRTWLRSLAGAALDTFQAAYYDDSGRPWQSAGDVALWAPICYLARTIRGTPMPVYHVNMDNAESDWRLEGGLQMTTAEAIKRRWEDMLARSEYAI